MSFLQIDNRNISDISLFTVMSYPKNKPLACFYTSGFYFVGKFLVLPKVRPHFYTQDHKMAGNRSIQNTKLIIICLIC